MADCQALQESSGYNEIADLIDRYDANLPSLYVDTQQQYDSVKLQINRAISTVNNYRSRLDAAIKILVAGGCSALLASRPYGQLKYWQEGLASNLNTLNTAWDAKNNTIAASEKASTTQNNAGTGTPGTAGTGPGASPAPAPSPTIVTGPTGASAPATTATGATGPKPVTQPTSGATGATGPAAPSTGTNAPQAQGTSQGAQGAKQEAQQSASRQDAINYARAGDWRVRLALAPNAKYLYDVKEGQAAGILSPLRATDGVIFPYTPSISISYAANYEPTSITHSNYKLYQYQNSSVDNININADFTAQDTYEANYLLAVIHFFRTVTKMFYGQDQDPKAGTPPPLCYLYGLGQFQFNAHPLVITNFNYNLPPDVDYIRADSIISDFLNISAANTPTNTPPDGSSTRTSGTGQAIDQGGVRSPPKWRTTASGTKEPTYVPTKIQLQINAVPIISRNDISNRFSVKNYATGELLRGKTNPTSGGIW